MGRMPGGGDIHPLRMEYTPQVPSSSPPLGFLGWSCSLGPQKLFILAQHQAGSGTGGKTWFKGPQVKPLSLLLLTPYKAT